MLILVISILNSASLVNALYVFLIVASYGLVLLIFFRPALSSFLDRVSTTHPHHYQKGLLAALFIGIFLSAFFTEVAGK